MKEYLQERKGHKLGILRAGMPKEVYFEAVVKDVRGSLVILENPAGQELALPLDKILMIGPAEKEAGPEKAGFLP